MDAETRTIRQFRGDDVWRDDEGTIWMRLPEAVESIKLARDAALTEARNAIIDLASALTTAAMDAEGMAFAIGASKGVAAIRHLQEGDK